MHAPMIYFESLSQADILAVDDSGHPVLIVQIKRVPPLAESVAQLTKTMKDHEPPIPFGMLADDRRIQVFLPGSDEPVVTLNTTNVLSRYEPAFPERRIHEPYFSALVESWLGDLVNHWKCDDPPGRVELERIGLIERLSPEHPWARRCGLTARIYVETNFVIGFAQGRSLAIDQLMRQPIPGAALMLPTP